MNFQSTLPVRGATNESLQNGDCLIISIHAPREESDGVAIGLLQSLPISIHAPREGSDSKVVQIKLSVLDNVQQILL